MFSVVAISGLMNNTLRWSANLKECVEAVLGLRRFQVSRPPPLGVQQTAQCRLHDVCVRRRDWTDPVTLLRGLRRVVWLLVAEIGQRRDSTVVRRRPGLAGVARVLGVVAPRPSPTIHLAKCPKHAQGTVNICT